MNNQSNYFNEGCCRLCGDIDVANIACSSIRIICRYGSDNDYKTIEAAICGRYADKLYNYLSIEGGEKN